MSSSADRAPPSLLEIAEYDEAGRVTATYVQSESSSSSSSAAAGEKAAVDGGRELVRVDVLVSFDGGFYLVVDLCLGLVLFLSFFFSPVLYEKIL
jgi:hypothetical protein